MAVDAGQNAVRPDRAVQLFDVRSNAFVRLRRLSSAGATRGLSGRMAVLSAYPSVAIHHDLMRCACPHLQEPASRNRQRDGPHQPYPQPRMDRPAQVDQDLVQCRGRVASEPAPIGRRRPPASPQILQGCDLLSQVVEGALN